MRKITRVTARQMGFYLNSVRLMSAPNAIRAERPMRGSCAIIATVVIKSDVIAASTRGVVSTPQISVAQQDRASTDASKFEPFRFETPSIGARPRRAHDGYVVFHRGTSLVRSRSILSGDNRPR
jgi:hypothetical protein